MVQMRRAAVAVLAAAALSSCGAGSSSAGSEPDTQLAGAYNSCEKRIDNANAGSMSGRNFVELGDEGHSILVDTGTSDKALKALVCVLIQLDTSDAIISEMDSTSALQGVRNAEQDGIQYQWTYHPDSGMELTMTEE